MAMLNAVSSQLHCTVVGRGMGGTRLVHCGNGNFTLPLSPNFLRILATEAAGEPLRFARQCAAQAAALNVYFARLSAAELNMALRRERVFQRLRRVGVDLADFDHAMVLVNPPRRGLDPAARAIAARSQRCILVSCSSPQRLAEDLASMPHHEIVAAAFFDQFPYTDHVEVALEL